MITEEDFLAMTSKSHENRFIEMTSEEYLQLIGAGRSVRRLKKTAKKQKSPVHSSDAQGDLQAADLAELNQSPLQRELRMQIEKFSDLPKPVEELRFHPKRRWRFDLAWPEWMVAVEIQGGVHSRGRHVRGNGYEKDCEKLNEAVLLGWRVFYVTAKQIKSGAALDYISRAMFSSGTGQTTLASGE